MKTKHFNLRMSQRGIRASSAKVVRHFGKRDLNDKICLNVKHCEQLCRYIDEQLILLTKGKQSSLC